MASPHTPQLLPPQKLPLMNFLLSWTGTSLTRCWFQPWYVLPWLFFGQRRMYSDPKRARIIATLLLTTAVFSFLSTLVHSGWAGTNSYLLWGWEMLLIVSIIGAGNTLADRLPGSLALRKLITLVCMAALGVMGLYSVTIVMGMSFWYLDVSSTLRDFVPFGFYNVRLWSNCATWLLPLAVMASWVMRFHERKGLYVLALSVSALWLLAAFSSGARGHLVAIVASALVLAIFYRSKMPPLLKEGGIILVYGVLLYLVFVELVPALLLGQGSSGANVLRGGTSGRTLLWLIGLENSVRDFPLGQGALSYSREAAASPFATPHSVYIRWVAEYGWLALGAFAGAVAFWLRPIISQRRDLSSGIDAAPAVAILWSCLAALIHASVSGVFTNTHSLLVGVPVMILLVAMVRSAAGGGYLLGEATRAKYFILLPSFVFGLAMLYPTYGWYRASGAAAQPYIEEKGVPLAARFWQHGRYID
jgi:hypothetical protein